LPKLILPEKIYNKIRLPLYKMMKKILYPVAMKSQPRPQLDPKVKRELKKKYKPEVVKLGKLLGKDLVKLWGYA